MQELLAALALKIVSSPCQLSGLDIGMSLYGLRYMSCEVLEVRVLLSAILNKIKQSESKLQLRELSMSIVGGKRIHIRTHARPVHVIENSYFANCCLRSCPTAVLQASSWIRDDFLRVLSQKMENKMGLVQDGQPIETVEKPV